MIQHIIMTSDGKENILGGYFAQFERYYGLDRCRTVVCGFTLPELPFRQPNTRFYSIGRFDDYPAMRWSDALIKVLDNVADEVFILMLDDYWLTRPTDLNAVGMIYDYMGQFKYVLKFDLTRERLFADGGGKYLFGHNTYDTLGYLDLIKSDFASAYHLSLWGGMWRRDLLRRFLVKGETAQQIELNGTRRLQQAGDDIIVLGSRQAPLLHANVIQGGVWNQDAMVGLPALKPGDREELRRRGYVP